MTHAPPRHREPRRAAGFTMIEAAMSLVIVSTMIVVALNAVSGSRATVRVISDRAKAMMLAEDMLTEILEKYYAEPGNPGASLGSGGGETRATFDDVDDFHNVTYAPPKYPNGAAIPGYDANWSVNVQTPWVDPYNLAVTRSYATGVKRITVTVKRGSSVLAQVVAVRTLGWAGLDGSKYMP